MNRTTLSLPHWILIICALLAPASAMSPAQPEAKVVASITNHFFVMLPLDGGKRIHGKCYEVLVDGQMELRWQTTWDGEPSRVYLAPDGKCLAREIRDYKNGLPGKVSRLEFYREGKLVKKYAIGETIKHTYENGETVEAKFETRSEAELDADSAKNEPSLTNGIEDRLKLPEPQSEMIENFIRNLDGWILRYPITRGKQLNFITSTGDLVYITE